MQADRFLIFHHQVLRSLMLRLAHTRVHDVDHPADPRQRARLRERLAHELDIHEAIENRIFYPAVEGVTVLVPVSRSEHRVLADQMAAFLAADPDSDEFGERLHLLQEAVEGHALSEERFMFPAARDLGVAALESIGAALERRFDELHASRYERAKRRVRHALLRRVPA